MFTALHITVADRSTGLALVVPSNRIDAAKQMLAGVSFANLPATDQYETLLTDLLFDVPQFRLVRIEDVEIR